MVSCLAMTTDPPEISKPIRHTNKPDSPLVKEGTELPKPEDPDLLANCVYNSEEYGEGSVVCMLGYYTRCHNGTWVGSNNRC